MPTVLSSNTRRPRAARTPGYILGGILMLAALAGSPVAAQSTTVPDRVPGGFRALELRTTGGVSLTWSDATQNESGFEIAREKLVNRAWVEATTLTAPANSGEFADNPGSGLFRYRVRAVNDAGASPYTAWRSVSVRSSRVTEAPEFAVTPAAENSGVRISWESDATGAAGYQIVRQELVNQQWVRSGAFQVNADDTGMLDAVDGGVYRYTIRSFNRSGSSPFSPWEEVTVAGLNGGSTATPAEPAFSAPSGLRATMGGTDRQEVRLTWVDQSEGETGFEISRETYLPNRQWGAGATLSAPAGATSFADTPGAGTHRYRVRAMKGTTASDFTTWANASVRALPPSAPGTPAAVDDDSAGKITFSWTDTSANEEGFQVVRQRDRGGRWQAAGSFVVDANETSFTDQPPALGGWRYMVRAYNRAGASAYSDFALATLDAPQTEVPPTEEPPTEEPPPEPTPTAPLAPSDVTVQVMIDAGKVMLGWRDNADNESEFQLERQALSSGTWGSPVMLTVAANATAFEDTPGRGSFRYRIKAMNTTGASSTTEWAVAVIPVPAPSAPGTIAAVDTGSEQARVTWADPTSDESGFEIERDPAFEAGTVRVGANVISYTDPSGPGSFSYRVRTVRDGVTSAYTAWILTGGGQPLSGFAPGAG